MIDIHFAHVDLARVFAARQDTVGAGTRRKDIACKRVPHYSTFNTSFIAFFSVSLGKAPTAICGLSFSGTKRMLGML